MDTLREKIINHLLGFIKKQEREIRTSDLYDETMRQFASELKSKCSNNNPFADEMFAESVIRESHVLYGLTYTAENDKLIGLTEEGNKAARHPNGIKGYLIDKDKEKKSKKRRECILSYAETTAAIVAIVSFILDYTKPQFVWPKNLGYIIFGAIVTIIIMRYTKK